VAALALPGRPTGQEGQQRDIDSEVRPYSLCAVGIGASYRDPVSRLSGYGRVRCGRGGAGVASCVRRSRRAGQTARQAISEFASGALAEVERGAERSSGRPLRAGSSTVRWRMEDRWRASYW
jgi:hypothetical protein